ncbi:YadA-like family protein [Caballeronia novacaledonica]|nr:YadA-like family protein [Caballeronia novacaledonica]
MGPNFSGVLLEGDPNKYIRVGADGNMVLQTQGTSMFNAPTISFRDNTLSNVGIGLINASSTDAVNGGQLFSLSASVSTTISSISFGFDSMSVAVIHGVSTGLAPTDLINKAQLDALAGKVANVSVGDDPMFAADGDRTSEAAVASGTHATASGTNAQATGANSVAHGASAVASGVGAVAIGAGSHATADDSVALGASSVADRSNTVSVGSAGHERQITNVAIGAQDTDLVNVNQLNDAVAQSNSYTDSMVSGMQGAVAEVGRSAYSGIAAATALAMIPNIDQDKLMSVGVGGATYQGYAAAAVALNLRVTQNLVPKAGAGSSRSGTVYGANASYRW